MNDQSPFYFQLPLDVKMEVILGSIILLLQNKVSPWKKSLQEIVKVYNMLYLTTEEMLIFIFKM